MKIAIMEFAPISISFDLPTQPYIDNPAGFGIGIDDTRSKSQIQDIDTSM